MLGSMALRVVCALVAGAAGAVPSLARAQEWSVQSGAAVARRVQRQLFLHVRRYAVGIHRVDYSIRDGGSANRNERSGCARRRRRQQGLGSLVERRLRERPFRPRRVGARSTLDVDREAHHSCDRPTLQNESGQPGAPLVLAFTNAAIRERRVHATRLPNAGRWVRAAEAYDNRYDGVATAARHSRTTMATTPAATSDTRIRTARSSR